MSYRDGELFALLPANQRYRDALAGGQLEAFIAVLGEQGDVVEDNLRELYDNWFIETCKPWAVPYLGELLRVRGIHDLGAGDDRTRAYVANTLRYRRRKGTVAVLEELARDVTLWQARAAEFFLQLDTTQHLNHLRLGHHRTPSLTDVDALRRIDGPFDTVAHTVDVRRPVSGRGKHNIANIGIFLWRLEAYPVMQGVARSAVEPADGRYRFSPLGLGAPVFNLPDTEENIDELADELDVPGELQRRPLAAELDGRRQAVVDAASVPQGFLRDENPALEIFVQESAGDPLTKVPTEEIQVCDLADLTPGGEWRRPSTTRDYMPTAGGAAVSMPIAVAVDPDRGRLAFPSGVVPNQVRVSYAYAFSGDVGGGPYPRPEPVDGFEAPRPGSSVFRAVVTSDQSSLAADPALFMASLVEAVDAWHAHIATDPASYGVIAFDDSGTYETAAVPMIRVPESARLAFVAGDSVASGGFVRQPVRPHLLGNLRVRGTASNASDDPGQVLVDGLLVQGDLAVAAGSLGMLNVLHSTVTGRVRVVATAARPNDRLTVVVDRSIVRRVQLPDTVPTLSLTDSIVYLNAATLAIQAAGSAAELNSVTVIGSTSVGSIEASDCIFTEELVVERAQVGCVRFSFVAPRATTRTPRRYRCQPDLALAEVNDPTELARVTARMIPVFTSRRYGNPGFAQLGAATPNEIKNGAEDEAEMGAFRFLAQPQRRENLDVALGEYLRFGMEPGVFYVN